MKVYERRASLCLSEDVVLLNGGFYGFWNVLVGGGALSRSRLPRSKHYVKVFNGLLTNEHLGQMGNAVWLFLWLLDKETKVKDGWGMVLGGKPIKVSDIPFTAVSKRTLGTWMRNLEHWKYIKTIRTPYGLKVLINKSRREEVWAARMGESQLAPRNSEDPAGRDRVAGPQASSPENCSSQNDGFNREIGKGKNAVDSDKSSRNAERRENGRKIPVSANMEVKKFSDQGSNICSSNKENTVDNINRKGEETKTTDLFSGYGTVQSREVSRVNEFFGFWHALYLEKWGQGYVFQGGKDGMAIKRILGKISFTEACSLAEVYMDMEDSWYVKKGYDLQTFVSDINAIRLKKSGKGQSPSGLKKGREDYGY